MTQDVLPDSPRRLDIGCKALRCPSRPRSVFNILFRSIHFLPQTYAKTSGKTNGERSTHLDLCRRCVSSPEDCPDYAGHGCCRCTGVNVRTSFYSRRKSRRLSGNDNVAPPHWGGEYGYGAVYLLRLYAWIRDLCTSDIRTGILRFHLHPIIGHERPSRAKVGPPHQVLPFGSDRAKPRVIVFVSRPSSTYFMLGRIGLDTSISVYSSG